MKALFKWVLRILLMLVLAAVVVGFWKREELQRLMAVNSLFSEEKIVHNFSHMDEAFLTVDLPRGDGPTWELALRPGFDLPEDTDAMDRGSRSDLSAGDAGRANPVRRILSGHDARGSPDFMVGCQKLSVGSVRHPAGRRALSSRWTIRW